MISFLFNINNCAKLTLVLKATATQKKPTVYCIQSDCRSFEDIVTWCYSRQVLKK